MQVTITDGSTPRVYDLNTKSSFMGRLNQHALRFQIYEGGESGRGTAKKQFVTNDRDLQNELLFLARQWGGHVNHDNMWIKPVARRVELLDASRYKEIAEKDLKSWFPMADVEVTSCKKRYIYYISDGEMKHTPDAIGVAFKHPLIFKGYAIATIFTVDGVNVLAPDANVVYWLTKPMWDGFHTGKRKSPRDFPWPTGFVCTKWCQREGYHSYGAGTYLASMSQGQTLGSWAAISLRQYHIQRHSNDPYKKYFGGLLDRGGSGEGSNNRYFEYTVRAVGTELGMISLRCVECGSVLISPLGSCPDCHQYSSIGSIIQAADSYGMCTKCGKSGKHCKCNDQSLVWTVSSDSLRAHYAKITSSSKNNVKVYSI